MELFERIVFEFIFGYIMQGFAFVLGIYAFNRRKIHAKNYVLVSLLLALISILVRLLPINFGVHTVLDLIALFLFSVIFLKMPFYITIRSTLFVTVLLLLTEMGNVALMTSIYGQVKFNQILLDPLSKALTAAPGAFTFAVLILIAYLVLTRNKKVKSDDVGKISS